MYEKAAMLIKKEIIKTEKFMKNSRNEIRKMNLIFLKH